MHFPARHVSLPLQKFPSLQLAPSSFGMCLHPPTALSHESVVHGSPSSQFGGGPLRQMPSAARLHAVARLAVAAREAVRRPLPRGAHARVTGLEAVAHESVAARRALGRNGSVDAHARLAGVDAVAGLVVAAARAVRRGRPRRALPGLAGLAAVALVAVAAARAVRPRDAAHADAALADVVVGARVAGVAAPAVGCRRAGLAAAVLAHLGAVARIAVGALRVEGTRRLRGDGRRRQHAPRHKQEEGSHQCPRWPANQARAEQLSRRHATGKRGKASGCWPGDLTGTRALAPLPRGVRPLGPSDCPNGSVRAPRSFSCRRR